MCYESSPWIPFRPGLSLREKEGFITPTETKVHEDALCFLVLGPSLLYMLAVGGGWRRLVVVGGGWRLAVVGGRQLVAVGSWWRLVVGGWRSLGAVLKGCPKWKKKSGFLRTALFLAVCTTVSP